MTYVPPVLSDHGGLLPLKPQCPEECAEGPKRSMYARLIDAMLGYVVRPVVNRPINVTGLCSAMLMLMLMLLCVSVSGLRRGDGGSVPHTE